MVKHSYISTKGRRRAGGASPKVVAIWTGACACEIYPAPAWPDREPGGRDFFNEEEDNTDASEMKQAIRELDNGVVVHKITLAPEINPEDKQAFTREVMKELGDDKGLDLRWWAVEHNNTQHHHIHVVVLGKDKSWREVRLDKRDYDRIKEYGDRHLERRQPYEMEQARLESVSAKSRSADSCAINSVKLSARANKGRNGAAVDAWKNCTGAA